MKRRALSIALTVAVCGALLGCSSTTSKDSGETTAAATNTVVSTEAVTTSPVSSASSESTTAPKSSVTGDRPFTVNEPSGYDPNVPAPLLVVLHGYTANGESAKAFFGLQDAASKRGYLTVYPNGTKDGSGAPFWNATDACCNFGGSEVDDSAYLEAIVTDLQLRYAVDPKRIYFAGHSNGGFMSYRMACEHADTIAAIVSVAGAMVDDTSKCQPFGPVSVAQVHGTADAVISFDGSAIGGNAYPSATDSVADWANVDGCKAPLKPTPTPVDFDSSVAGPETTVSAYGDCRASAVELWTIANGAHGPSFTPAFGNAVLDFFDAHPKQTA